MASFPRLIDGEMALPTGVAPTLNIIVKLKQITMPSGKKRKGHKMATHKRKKRLRKNRHKNKK